MSSVFTEVKFYLLIIFSVVIPIAVYVFLLLKRSISRWVVLLFGLFLVGIAGLDIYLLQSLRIMTKLSSSLIDDAIFNSELSLAFYLLPALIGGIGTNIISNILASHLTLAENRFSESHSDNKRSGLPQQP